MEGKKTLKKVNNSHEKPSTIVAKEINYFILEKHFIQLFLKSFYFIYLKFLSYLSDVDLLYPCVIF